MDDMPRKKVDDKTKALEWPDSLLYDVVGLHNQSELKRQKRTRERMCSAMTVTNQTVRPCDARPQTLPFLREELEGFITKDLPALKGHYWSVLWATTHRNHVDVRYDDDYRGVIVFNTMEFMIRPVQELRKDDVGQPQRLHIYPLDLKEILTLALQTDPGLGERTTMAMGLGSANNPESMKSRNMPEVTFEWRIDLAQESTVERLVTKWRGRVIGGTVHAYRTIKKKHDKQRKRDALVAAAAAAEASMLSQPDSLLRSYVPEAQREQGPSPAQPSAVLFESTPQMRKRSNLSLGDDTVPGPSRKRLTIGSRSAGDSRAGTGSHSGTSSMGMMRPFPLPSAGDLSARPPVLQRSSQASTEFWRRPEASSSTIRHEKTYTASGYQIQTSNSVGSSSNNRPRTTPPPMSGVTRGLSTLGLMSLAPTVGKPESRQKERRGAYRDGNPLSAFNQSRNISHAPGYRRPRPINATRANQASPDDGEFDRPTLRPLASHVYNNTAPPRQPPPTLIPLVIPPLDGRPPRRPPRSTPQPSMNLPSIPQSDISSSQYYKFPNQRMVASPSDDQYPPPHRQDPRTARQGIWTGQGGAARIPHGPNMSDRRDLGGFQPGYQGHSGRGGGEASGRPTHLECD